MDKDGFVVIHADADGTFGDVIGNSEVVIGAHENFQVSIDVELAGDKVWAMLHYDDDNDGVYDFPDADAPVVVNEEVLVKAIVLSPAETTTDTTTVTQ